MSKEFFLVWIINVGNKLSKLSMLKEIFIYQD